LAEQTVAGGIGLGKARAGGQQTEREGYFLSQVHIILIPM
jgi:hypothetical protein